MFRSTILNQRTKISLTNFRHHRALELNLPSRGLVRLNGRSGTGKSSVLDAIRFALFGSVRNLTSWGEKTSSVSFNGYGLDVVRSKNPNILSANGDASVVAESEIQRILGMNKLEFEVSSYVQQKQKNSLITKSSAEQEALIHALAFQNTDPNQAKDKIKGKISESEASMAELDKEALLYSESLRKTLQALEDLSAMLDGAQDATEADQQEFQELTHKEKLLGVEIDGLRHSKSLLMQEAEHPLRSKFEAATDFIERQPSLAANIEQSLRDVSVVQWDKTSYDAEIQTLNRDYASMAAKLAQIQKAIQETELSGQARADLQTSVELLQEAASLVSTDSTEDEFLALKKQTEVALRACVFLKNSKLASEDEAKAQQNVVQLERSLLTLNASRERLEEARNEFVAASGKKSLLNEQLQKLQAKKLSAEEIIKQNTELRTLKEIQQELQDVSEAENQKRTEKNSLLERKNELVKKIQALQNNTKIRTSIAKNKAEQDQVEQLLANVNKKRNFIANRLSELHRLLELWHKTVLEVIDSTINEINIRAAFWLDLLLEGLVRAEIKTSRKLKSKDVEKDGITLEVYCRGQLLENISEELSGGQYSRVALAFQCALSDMYNSPILLLDEALQGCDAEAMEKCIDGLKTISMRKLVVVIEHHIPDHHFDEVLDLAEV
jgi:DNA repair protein SbcC/Rad50